MKARWRDAPLALRDSVVSNIRNIFRNLFTRRKRKMSGKNKDHFFANLMCKVGAAFLGKASWECRWVVFQIWLQNKAFVELKLYRILGKYSSSVSNSSLS